jgi:hypothetical protein
MKGPSPICAPSSGSTTRCRSTRAASASSPATTPSRPPTWGSRWWRSGCSTAGATSARKSTWTATSSTSTRARPAQAPGPPVVTNGGGQLKVPIEFPGREVYVAVWKLDVGRVPLLLLDTDIPENDPGRPAHHPPAVRGRAGDALLSGAGAGRRRRPGARGAGDRTGAWHVNEGHAAMSVLERTAQQMEAALARHRPRADPGAHALHPPHPGPGRQRGLRRPIARQVHGPVGRADRDSTWTA